MSITHTHTYIHTYIYTYIHSILGHVGLNENMKNPFDPSF